MGRIRLNAGRPPLPPGVVEYEVPKGSGKWFVYYRQKGQKDIRMRGVPGTEEWESMYRRLRAGERPEEKSGPALAGDSTFAWLCQQYMASTKFAELDPRTQRVRRLILEHCMNDKPLGGKATFGEVPLSRFTAKSVAALRDLKREFPEAANGRVKAVRAVFAWACMAEVGIALTNPARDVAYRPKNNPDGHHSWTIEDVERFEARHPIGTKARLAMALLLYTAQRRSDIVLLGRGHERHGGTWLHLTQQKNRRNSPITLDIPMRPELRAIIDASPVGEITYLVNEFGRPFTANGFGNWFRKRCDEVDPPLKDCSAHGLRKAAATRLADNGATAHEIKAITGHKTLKEVERYTKAADQRRLAEAASKRG